MHRIFYYYIKTSEHPKKGEGGREISKNGHNKTDEPKRERKDLERRGKKGEAKTNRRAPSFAIRDER